ncbi:hypothetical protein HYX00_05000 [Candidatus Woesearchaeota archaeon]|nr:hypothetical protein [Candidatus Woesearchaeota archaeon]
MTYLTPDDIIKDPSNARKHWSQLSSEQKDLVYARVDGLKEFSDFFNAEKGIKSLDLKLGKTFYDGTKLVNGGTKISTDDLKNAEVVALAEGGFKIKFLDNSDLSSLDFNGGKNGISFEGNNLKFKEGLLSRGAITLFDSNVRIGPNSIFVTNKVEFTTKDKEFDLYYMETNKQNQFIEINKLDNKIRIVGDGITAEFLKEHEFEELFVRGEITVVNGDYILDFDGQGNSFVRIPIGNPTSYLEISDENAPDKKYVLDPSKDNQNLKGYGGCAPATGFAVLEITGKTTYGICKGPLIKTGKSFNAAPEFPYKVELFINEEQIGKVKQEFILKHGREPNLENKKDLEKIGELINRHVTDLKIRQTFLFDKTFSTAQAYAVIAVLLGRSNVYPSLWDLGDVNKLVQLAKEVRNGDTVEYQLSSKEGLITAYPKNAPSMQIPISRKILDGLAQNFYNPTVNSAPDESRNLLKPYFASKKVALK